MNLESSILSSLPIPELIKCIKHTFLERDFNEVQTILMERENDMKIEIENLTRDRDSAKEELRLLERIGDSVDLERLNLEENLRKSRRKCEELEEKVVRLLEEVKVSNDRERRADERCDKIFAANTKLTIEKNKSISELNDKINLLKIENLENERLLGDYKEKCKCLDVKVANMEQAIEGLTREKLDAFKAIEELKAKNSEADKTIDELKLKKSEFDEVAELYKNINEGLSNILTVKGGYIADIADLAELYEKTGKLASEGRVNLEFPGFKDKNDSPGNDTTPDAAEIVAVDAKLPGVRKSLISTGNKIDVLSKRGDRNSVQHRTRDDDDVARTVNTRVSLPVCDPLQAESNRHKEQLDSGVHANGTRLIPIAQRSTKSTRSPSAAAGDIIEIVESDDETNPDEKAHIPNSVLSSNPSKNKRNFVQSLFSEQGSKRNRADSEEGFFANSTTTKKRNTCSSGIDTVSIAKKENQTPKPTTTLDRVDCSSYKNCAGDEARTVCGAQTPVEKFNNGLTDKDSESSDDESLSDSRMAGLVASLRNKSIRSRRKIVYEADMLSAIQEDAELCMNAVCALYRHEVIARKSKGRSDSSKNEGFSPNDSMSGCELAEYLIDGDKELRLRKSVPEVKKQRPDVIGRCRKLANNYVEKLFEIYCSGKDPLFSES